MKGYGRRWLFWVPALTASIWCGNAQAEKFNVPAGWDGSVYYDNSGNLTRCVATVPYKSGTALFLSAERNFDFGFGFANNKWKGLPNSVLDLWFQFDNGEWQRINGNANSSGFVFVGSVNLNQNAAINYFKTSFVLHFRFGAFSYGFDLTNVSDTLVDLAQCVSTHQTKRAPEPRLAQQKKPKAVLPMPKQSMVVSKTPEHKIFTGTGIKLNKDGYVLTNNHVVEGCETIQIVEDGKTERQVHLIRADKSNDLAVLKSDAPFLENEIANIRVSPSVKAGEVVAVYGFPLTGILSQSGNIVGGNISSLAGIGDDARFFQISAPVQPGNSGGPLLDESGNVIGIVNARINDISVANATGTIPQNVNFSIKANIAANFLETHSIKYSSDVKSNKLPLSDIATEAKRLATMVICKQ